MLIHFKTNLYRRICSLSVLNQSKYLINLNRFSFGENLNASNKNLTDDQEEIEENHESFWDYFENLKNQRVCNELDQKTQTRLKFEWMNKHRIWAKNCKVNIQINKKKMGLKKYLCEIKIKRRLLDNKIMTYSIYGGPSETEKLALKRSFENFYNFVAERNLLQLINSKQKPSLNVASFLKKFRQASIEKDIEKIKILIDLIKDKPFGVDNLNYIYESLLLTLDLEFAEQIASLIYENINLKDADFISKHDCEYYKLYRFLLFFEIIEGIVMSMKGMERRANVSLVVSKNLGNDIFMCQLADLNNNSKNNNNNSNSSSNSHDDFDYSYEDNYNNNSYRNSFRDKLVPDSYVREDKDREFKAIAKGDYVLLQNQTKETSVLAEVYSIDINYEVKLKCLIDLKEKDNIKIIKLTTSVPTDVFVRNLRNFTLHKNSCCDKLRSLITRSNEVNAKLKEIAEEHVKQLDENYTLSNEMLTQAQSEAIKQALTRRLTLIQGPPGTGKTKTAAEIVREWIKVDPESTVLVTADSNIAVDNIFKELVKLGIKPLRIGSGSNLKQFFGTQSMSQAFMMLKKYPKNIKVVCATCVGSSAQSLERLQFERVLIDEAAQSTEVSNIAALVNNTKQLVIIGDHKQLPPTVQSKIAEKYGYSISLFERLVNLGIKPVFLDVQYRMHPLIAEFSSMQFYDGLLKTGITSDQRPLIQGFNWPNPKVPIAFININWSNEKFIGNSFYNLTEVDKVIQIVKSLDNAKTIRLDQIGIVTPYDAQKQKLKDAVNNQKLGRSNYTKNDLNVNTVDGFQGMEKELIIFSAVRSNMRDKVGFLADQRRLNVMLTRARSGIIVVGNKTTLRSNEQWKKWIDWCEKYNVIVDDKDNNMNNKYKNLPNEVENEDFDFEI